ncbi:MAG: Gfo/Idh/MocA family oxidoreductase [Bacteroidota bacterium]
MSNKIRWGIIGCGDVTERKSGPAFSLIERSMLAAVMRRDAAKAEDYARRHNVPKWYSNADELLDDPAVNAVYVATPPSSHKEYVIKALAKGLPVYVEKPAAMNAAEVLEISEAAYRHSGKICVAHYRRALPMFQFVKKILDEQMIGHVSMVQADLWQSPAPSLAAQSGNNWRIDPAVSGGGLFHDLSPHLLDLMLYYFGEPVRYQGSSMNQSRRYGADDIVTGQMIFEGSILFNGTWNFSVGETEARDTCVIVGSGGSISFSLFGSDVVIRTRQEQTVHHFDHPIHIQQPMIEAVTKYFQGTGGNPCPIETGLTVMRVIDSFTQHSMKEEKYEI